MEITKEKAKDMGEALNEIMKAMPKTKVMDFVGHFNDLFVFLGEVERNI